MQYIGCHLTISKGFFAMGRQALALGGNTAQFFTRNPRGGKARELDLEDINKLSELMTNHHFGSLIAHAPYTINPCAANEKTLEFAHMAMAEDLKRLDALPGTLYNFHPGSHVGQGTEIGIEKIAQTLNQVMYPEMKSTILLETMAGKGTEVGSRFEELREIIDRTTLSDKIGVCLDTCHVHDGGYDIVNDLDGVLTEFDKIVGLHRLKALHLNDSMNPMGSHKDRHQKLGQGSMGLEPFRKIINHPVLKPLPKVLETPNELPGYQAEIQMLRELEG